MHKHKEETMSEEKDIKSNEEMDDSTSSNIDPGEQETPSEVDNGGEEKDEATVLKEKIKLLEEENSDLKNRLLRKQADFENFRKRINKDKEDSIKYANQMLLLDITGTIDNFERAIQSAEESKNFDSFHDGIVMIEKHLITTLENNWNLKRFNSKGEHFDPERHLALAADESPDVEVETVVEEFQKGYLFHDRILRPAKVKVCKPGAGNESENNNDKEVKE